MVERRCATTIVVLPFCSLSSADWTSRSELASSAELDAILADAGVVSPWQFRDEIMRGGEFGGLDDFRIGRLQRAVGDIVPHRVVKNGGFLADQRHVFAQG